MLICTGEVKFEISKRLKSQLKNTEINVWLSRKENQSTNEGFGYVYFKSVSLAQKVIKENLKILVKKQAVEICKPVNRQTMRKFLLDYRERQLHVSGLNKKISKGI